jgi:hypothetical protein
MEKQHLTRKLAVILHVDVVGSTALVQMNETLTRGLDRLRLLGYSSLDINGIKRLLRSEF